MLALTTLLIFNTPRNYTKFDDGLMKSFPSDEIDFSLHRV